MRLLPPSIGQDAETIGVLDRDRRFLRLRHLSVSAKKSRSVGSSGEGKRVLHSPPELERIVPLVEIRAAEQTPENSYPYRAHLWMAKAGQNRSQWKVARCLFQMPVCSLVSGWGLARLVRKIAARGANDAATEGPPEAG